MAVERRNQKLNGWGEDKEEVSQFMPRLANYEGNSTTLDLLGRSMRNSPSPPSLCSSELTGFDLLELGKGQFLPFGWEKCLDLKTGAVYYLNSEEGTEVSSEAFSSQNSSELSFIEGGGEGERLDLNLNLCISKVHKTRKKNYNDHISTTDNIPQESAPAMRLVGCQKCLMYFMLCSQDANCPKCKGGFLLDFLHRDPFCQEINKI